MKIFAISALAAGVLGLAAAGANAATDTGTGTITFNGALTAQTCDVSGQGGGEDFTVVLPTISTAKLPNAGATDGKMSYTIELKNCTPVTATSKAGVFYQSGATVDATDGRLLNTNTTDGAQNVKLELLNSDDSLIKVGYSRDLQNEKAADISSGGALLTYQVRYFATGVTTAGPVTSQVVYSIDYQ